MKMSSSSSSSTAIIVLLSLVFATLSGQCRGGDVPLQVGFYRGKCGIADVEAIVGRVVLAQFMKDTTITAALLRMQFHDCFVNGCDASILLDGNNTEKTAGPNLSVRGYEIIDAAKAAVEAICPGVVSCADIIVIATRDAVALDRLYNFQKTGKPDPTMDSTLLTALRARCPQNTTVDNTANLDQNPLSSMTVDNSYYRQIILHRGILQIDQELALDPLSKQTVTAIANGFDFSTRFGQAMIKLGAVQVLTGKQGEIRRSCRATNKPSK
ncbi:UNVERIFIED_CONTAM: Peroxidase 60 [Sesamum latifolium]|uniref:peroxidase n=1 Tax=Sesamum latifolium TaxID=2727402 RepID=A0AAW2Y2S7_9LAMI